MITGEAREAAAHDPAGGLPLVLHMWWVWLRAVVGMARRWGGRGAGPMDLLFKPIPPPLLYGVLQCAAEAPHVLLRRAAVLFIFLFSYFSVY